MIQIRPRDYAMFVRLCFSIDQPYNRFWKTTFVPPKNLIRVKEWPEIRNGLSNLYL